MGSSDTKFVMYRTWRKKIFLMTSYSYTFTNLNMCLYIDRHIYLDSSSYIRYMNNFEDCWFHTLNMSLGLGHSENLVLENYKVSF